MLPIDIPEDPKSQTFKKRLGEFINESRPEPETYVVYILECQTPPEQEFRNRVNRIYQPEDSKRKRDIRRRWEATREDDAWDEDDLEKAVQVHLDKGYRKEDMFERINWVRKAFEAEEVYYVGLSSDLERRIAEHIKESSSKGAVFTSIVPPTQLVQVDWFESKSAAEKAESETATKLQELPERFSKGGVIQF